MLKNSAYIIPYNFYGFKIIPYNFYGFKDSVYMNFLIKIIYTEL